MYHENDHCDSTSELKSVMEVKAGNKKKEDLQRHEIIASTSATDEKKMDVEPLL